MHPQRRCSTRQGPHAEDVVTKFDLGGLDGEHGGDLRSQPAQEGQGIYSSVTGRMIVEHRPAGTLWATRCG